MQKFLTFALYISALVAVGNCVDYGNPGYGRPSDSSSSAASSAASDTAQVIAPVVRPAYPAVLRPAYPAIQRTAYPAVPRAAYPIAQPYGIPGAYNIPKTSVQPAGAAMLYPGINSYKSYDSPPLYSKVILPVRPAAPVANLYVPEGRRYGVAY